MPPHPCHALQAIIRPWRLGRVVEQLNASGIRGMTVADVKGAGVQGGAWQAVQNANANALGILASWLLVACSCL
jgi:nitrogen regulatory protein PII